MTTGIYLVLGSNLGDRRRNLSAAVARIADYADVLSVGPVYETAPFGEVEQGNFLNTALSIETDLAAKNLLKGMKEIEKRLGRVPSGRWGPRVIDIDIALFGDEIVETAELTVPHPGLNKRDFFLRPILDIAPELRDPASGELLKDILAGIGPEDRTIIRKAKGREWQTITT